MKMASCGVMEGFVMQCLPWETCYPIILPRSHWVTTLIIKHAHKQTQHGGTNHVLAQLSVQYWLILARRVRKSAWSAKEERLPQPSRLWPLCLSCALGSLNLPSAKHLLTLVDLLSLNKEEARPGRRGTLSIHMLSDKGCAPGSSIQP